MILTVGTVDGNFRPTVNGERAYLAVIAEGDMPPDSGDVMILVDIDRFMTWGRCIDDSALGHNGGWIVHAVAIGETHADNGWCYIPDAERPQPPK